MKNQLDSKFQPVCFEYPSDGEFNESRAIGSLEMLRGLQRLREFQKNGPATTNGKTSHCDTVQP